MPKRPRRLLMLATLACLVPLSGAQAPAFAEPMRSASECPYARAAAAAQLEAQSAAGARWTAASASLSIFDASRNAPELVP